MDLTIAWSIHGTLKLTVGPWKLAVPKGKDRLPPTMFQGLCCPLQIVTFMTWPSQSKLELFLKTFPRLVTWYLVFPTIDTGVPCEPLEGWKARKYDFWQEYTLYIIFSSCSLFFIYVIWYPFQPKTTKNHQNPSSLLSGRILGLQFLPFEELPQAFHGLRISDTPETPTNFRAKNWWLGSICLLFRRGFTFRLC